MSFLAAHTRAAGMTTSKWMELPPTVLIVVALTPTQYIADDLWPGRLPCPVACADPLIHVVRLGGVLYIEDGHHRWARARRDHDWTIQGRLLELAAARVSCPA